MKRKSIKSLCSIIIIVCLVASSALGVLAYGETCYFCGDRYEQATVPLVYLYSSSNTTTNINTSYMCPSHKVPLLEKCTHYYDYYQRIWRCGNCFKDNHVGCVVAKDAGTTYSYIYACGCSW